MSGVRKQWAAISYPDAEPVHLSPKAAGQRAKVRIGVRVARITLPLMLAAGLAAVAGSGGGGGATGPTTAATLYPGDKIALAVRLQLASHGLLAKGMSVDCADSAATAGSVSSCTTYSQQSSGDAAPFDVHFLDGHGHFAFTGPDGTTLEGTLV